jgi:hypothetical protein
MGGMKKHCSLARGGVIIGVCLLFLIAKAPNTHSGEKPQGKPRELPLFISATDTFKDLERPPVRFYHDKHTAALKEEGCGACHPENQNKAITGTYLYTYPKDKPKGSDQVLMDSYHGACMGCHNQRQKQGKKSGAVTCGGCHVKEEREVLEYGAVGPAYYSGVDDIYHKDCIACHKGNEKVKKEAEPLDWKEFYITIRKQEEARWPASVHDYYWHYQHEKALEKKCDLCHHLYSEEQKKLIYQEGTESSCQDCHRGKDEKKKRSYRNVAHSQCITCHLNRDKVGQKAGPATCGGCHGKEKQRTLQELADIPRPQVKQRDEYLIKIDDARMKEVPFGHKAHEGYTATCRACHHETQKACKECHPLKGIKEGGYVTLAQAYHEVSSQWSCIGCHDLKKAEPSCGGCHHFMKSGLAEGSCTICHSGPPDKARTPQTLSAPKELLPDKLDEEITIGLLEEQYKPSKFPHLKIIKKLSDLSHESKLARYFHTQEMTICRGCHHDSPLEAKKPVPPCNTCHSPQKQPRKGVPALFGAYHQQCVGCHEKMDLKIKPRDCSKCHEPKPKVEARKDNH